MPRFSKRLQKFFRTLAEKMSKEGFNPATDFISKCKIDDHFLTVEWRPFYVYIRCNKCGGEAATFEYMNFCSCGAVGADAMSGSSTHFRTIGETDSFKYVRKKIKRKRKGVDTN